MTRHQTEVRVEAAAVSDRGLNERRPLNEDAYFLDLDRHVFAVADGVGGAEAGEVASQTAIEVLEAAFRHQRDGEDVEDLLEIAIQRANDSIHRMSREHPKFSSMATTVVALKVEGLRATVGHVGDSRLYRHAPDGVLHRETEDHSVVEEEVRAGRMTPEQAQNHPSRNVISRALGAEADVEVDLKTFEVEPGTTFLLCTDGITRHVSDGELRSLLGSARDLTATCEELKRLCYERGAEDNLTAVLVRVGGPAAAGGDGWDEEQTLIVERPRTAAPSAPGDNGSRAQQAHDAADSPAPALAATAEAAAPSAHDTDSARPAAPVAPPAPAPHAAHAPAHRRRGSPLRVFFYLLLLILFSAAAFYGGMLYERRFLAEAPDSASNTPAAPAVAQPSPAPTVAPTADSFEFERTRVDSGFRAEAERRASEMSTQPLSGEDPQFLYLYGRALLLSNRPDEAAVQFRRAADKIRAQPKSSHMSLLIDSQLATVTARLRVNDVEGARQAAESLDTLLVGTTAQPSPSAGVMAPPQ